MNFLLRLSNLIQNVFGTTIQNFASLGWNNASLVAIQKQLFHPAFEFLHVLANI
jgi:hypothetical protein